MNARPLNRWVGVALTGATLASGGSAHAAGGGCEDLRVRVVGDVSPSWMDAIERACADLARLSSTDPSARVRISAEGDDLAVEVTLSDGRVASRRLQSPGALRSTLEALLVVPPQRAPQQPAAVVDKGPAPPTETTWPRLDEPEAVRPARAPAEPSVGVELGSSLGGRVAAHGYLSAAFDAFAEIRVGSWLLGTVFRWETVGDGVERFDLREGALRLRVRRAPSGRRVVVTLPDGELEDIGTVFEVVVAEGHTERVGVEEGRVVLRLTSAPSVTIGAGGGWRRIGVGASASASASASAATGAGASAPSTGSKPPASASNATRSTMDAKAGAEDKAYLEVLRLLAEGREPEARSAARAYLRDFPAGFRREEMQGVAAGE